MASGENYSSVRTERHFKGTSGAVEEDYSLEWKIENFLVIKSSADFIDQQIFPFETGTLGRIMTRLRWRCFLEEETESRKIGVYLNLTNAPMFFRSCVASFQFMAMRANGTVFKTGTDKLKQFTLGDSGYGFRDFIPSDEDELKELLWEDGSIVIKVKLQLFLFTPTAVVLANKGDLEVELNLFEKQELRKLSDYMARTIESDSQPETGKIIKVVSKDGKEFYANTALLSAGSPVFQAMFSTENWKEGQGSSGEAPLVLEDLSGKTVKVLLHYLMCGILLKEDWKAEDVILELTWAAGKYQLERLTKFLDKVLAALDYNGTEVLAKLALLASRLGMKNSEEKLLLKLKETAATIDELVLDKAGSLIEKD